MAYLLAHLVEKEGFAAERAPDGRRAGERMAQNPPPDLILLDVMLPYADGFELLIRMRTLPEWKTVPVIVLTARMHEEDAVRALALGADDYLTKPFSPAELVARIRRRLRPPAAA